MNIAAGSFVIEAPLLLPEREVQIWRADLELLRPEEDRWRKILSSDEVKRADRFHFPADRQRFTAARALLRMILGGYLQVAADRVKFAYSEKEKPSLGLPFQPNDVTFNVTHSAGVALYAFARNLEVGIDVESIHRNSDLEAIARRFFSAREQQQLAACLPDARVEAFFRCWTRKEAYIKATGDGLSLPLSQFDVSLEKNSADALLATRPNDEEAGKWTLTEVPAGEGFVGAVCARGRTLTFRCWSSSP